MINKRVGSASLRLYMGLMYSLLQLPMLLFRLLERNIVKPIKALEQRGLANSLCVFITSFSKIKNLGFYLVREKPACIVSH